MIAVGAVVLVVAVTAFSPRVGVAGPLVLVVIGIAVSFLPWVPPVSAEPEIVLSGVLPPLLFSSAVSMPSMDFRRDFRAISALSVVLVVLSSVAVGFLVAWLIPGIGLATGIALGAIVSPTDAVATSIVRHLGAPSRVVTVLEGESLLNDATALVLLRAAIAATAGVVSVWAVAERFLVSVAVAVVIGAIVGMLNLRIRRALRHPVAGTAISFVVPFVASVPADAFGASGLVAAVAAGLVTGNGLARYLRPQDRIADEQNWRTIELLLEGGIFLLMGLEVDGLVENLREAGGSMATAAWIGAAVAATVILVRAAHVTALLLGLGAQARRKAAGAVHRVAPEYLMSKPFTARERTVIVWAGMRGAVTLAAAQTLPGDTRQRAMLVLVAFVVAAGTLLLQGGTLPWLVTTLGVVDQDAAEAEAERAALLAAMNRAGIAVLDDPELRRPTGGPYDRTLVRAIRGSVAQASDLRRHQVLQEAKEQRFELRLAVIDMQRRALLDARRHGAYSSRTLREVLAALDAEQISIELKGGLPARLGNALNVSVSDPG
ncbi:cation:proton antiporter [Dactylosporangium sp. CA-092794]|uniref:cation:proton antiporter n=1 Tax=Dactylosporangium sp. CA-092794 TaxID=3239929 RepID=UPI003D8A7655